MIADNHPSCCYGNNGAMVDQYSFSSLAPETGGGGGSGNNGNSSFFSGNSQYYQGTPSPADSGVMSPMTPMSGYTTNGSDQGHLVTSPEHHHNYPGQASPFNHPSPADSGFSCSTLSPFPLTSPVTNGLDELSSTSSCVNSAQFEHMWQAHQLTNVAHHSANNTYHHGSLQKLGQDGGKDSCSDMTFPDHLGQMGKESSGVSLNTIPEIDDADLVAILKDVTAEGSDPSAEEFQEEDEEEMGSSKASRTTHSVMTTTTSTTTDLAEALDVSEAIHRMELSSTLPMTFPPQHHQFQVQQSSTSPRSKWGVKQMGAAKALASPPNIAPRLVSKKKKSKGKAVMNHQLTAIRSQPQPLQQNRIPSICNLPVTSAMPVQLHASQDMDHLYVNCNSNVSPDSGIQSEGVTSNSPLHLADGSLPITSTGSIVINGNPTVIHGQGFHPAFIGSNYTATTGQSLSQQQPFNQLSMWSTIHPQQQQHPGGFYGQFVQQPQHSQFSMTMAPGGSSLQYHHPNGPTVANLTALGQSKFMIQSSQQQQQQQPPLLPQTNQPLPAQLRHDDSPPPPVLLPSVSTATGTSIKSGSKSKVTTEVMVKRGRGRPKGSKNKVKKVTMECGSQTEESILDTRYSTDSDGSGASLPPPTIPKYLSSSSSHVRSNHVRCDQPPMLEPQVELKPPVGKANCDSKKSKPVRKECEVIQLSDENEVADDDIEDDGGHDEYQSSDEEPRTKSLKVKEKKSKHSKREKSKKKSKKSKSEFSHRKSKPSSPGSRSKTSKKSKSSHRSITPKNGRESSPSPTRSLTPVSDSARRVSRHDAFSESEIRKTSKPTFFDSAKATPIFDKKFMTLKPDRFWRTPTSSRSVSRSSNHNNVWPEEDVIRSSSTESSRVRTKASLKEMNSFQSLSAAPSTVISGGASTKTMLSVLAEANQRAKPGRKKRGRRSKSSEWADKDRTASPASGKSFSPRSITPNTDKDSKGKAKKKKKDKIWKSKHKNVIDPVLMSQVEYLIQDLASLQVEAKLSTDYWPDRPAGSVPSIFRKRKILTGRMRRTGTDDQKRRRANKRSSRDERDGDKTQGEAASEQRLPLKKRHHHHLAKSGDPSSAADDEKIESQPTPPTTSASTKKTSPVSTNISIIHESPSKKAASAADRIVEKLGMQNLLRRKSRSNSREEKRSTIKMLEESSERILGKCHSIKANAKASRNLSGLPQSKPLPPILTSAGSKSLNFVDSIAACVDKYTGNKATKALTIDTKTSSGSGGPAPKSPRKRHLLELQGRVNNDEPPSLTKAISPTLSDSKAPSSPPRLSPPHLSPVADIRNRLDEKEEVMSDASAGHHSWSVSSSSVSSEDERARRKPGPKRRKKGQEKQGGLKLLLKRTKTNEEVFKTLQKSAPKKPVKLVPMVSPKGEDAAVFNRQPSSSDDEIMKKSGDEDKIQKCSVQVKRLTEQEIVESTPSPSSTMDQDDDTIEEASVPTDMADESNNKQIKPESVMPKMKKRKRRSNKTGFPSIKRKKRPQSAESSASSRPPSKIKRPRKNLSDEDPKPQRQSARQQIQEEKRKEQQVQADDVAESKKRDESVEIIGEFLVDDQSSSSNSCGQDILSKAISQIQKESSASPEKMKKPRGRPPKKRITANSSSKEETKPLAMNPGIRIPLITDKRGSSAEDYQRQCKRSRLYEDIDDEIDCLALLPTVGMESGQSSEAPSGTEAEDDSRSRSSSVATKSSRRKSLFSKPSLRAGLFSDDYKKLDEPGARLPELKKAVPYNPEDHPEGLLPPPYYCGRALRQKRDDFQLPYDLWWLQANKQLPSRDVAITWNYKKIKNNIYYDVKPTAQFESQACVCSPSNLASDTPGCGEDCINRMTFTECDPRLCPMGDKCSNNAIQKHRAISSIERFMTESKGWGIRTRQKIQPGDFIMEYVGEVVSEKVFKHRMTHEYAEDTHHYCLHLDGGMVIDGHRVGGECRFVNHSCEPNCEIQKWSVNGIYRMGLFSLKDIKPGEELCYDYNFSLFNPHEGQSCRCGSQKCRGVIGGRSQRINGDPSDSGRTSRQSSQERSGRDRKRKMLHMKRMEAFGASSRMSLLAPVKNISIKEKLFVQDRQCFLVRNLEKIKRYRESIQRKVNADLSALALNGIRREESSAKPEDMILTGLTAMTTARSMQTRRLAIAQDDPNVTKVVRLAQLFREIFAQVTTIGDENGLSLSRFFNHLPSKKKHPQYYLLLTEPIDFQTIDRNINVGFYTSPEQFDQDILRLLQNNIRYFGHKSAEGEAALKMRKMYNAIKQEYHEVLKEILGSPEVAFCFRKREEPDQKDEDVIRCPCGQYEDEGVMIQCEKCQVWQHCDCVGVSSDVDSYFCEKCSGRNVSLDVVLVPQPSYASPGEKYFTSLLRDKLQICLGDTVYVLRAFKESEKKENGQETTASSPSEASPAITPPSSVDQGSSTAEDAPPAKPAEKEYQHGGILHKMMSPTKGPSQEASTLSKGNYPTFKTVDPNISTADMDIFRIERLWENEAGDRFAFGHHYLRSHETFHEPSRKFFHNEVFRAPVFEVLPLDTIWAKCWVLDLPTYCKGRPIDAVEEHVYICEYRVDKKARLFNKISKPKHTVCTKWFAFDFFDQKLKPQRNFAPHKVPEKWRSSSTPRARSLEDENRSLSNGRKTLAKPPNVSANLGNQTATSATSTASTAAAAAAAAALAAATARVSKKRDRQKQRLKLDETLLKLLAKLPDKEAVVDATYLLESDKRLRKKTNHHLSNSGYIC